MSDVGDTLSLLAAGIALFILLAASYSRRSTWIALGSITMSVALLSGGLLLATLRDRAQARASLAWVTTELPLLLDRETADELWASLQQIEAPWACGSSCSRDRAIAPRLAERHPVQAEATTAGWLETKRSSQGSVAWNLDNRDFQPVMSTWSFSISGTNVSGSVLEQVEAILKPDTDKREVPLVLSIEGNAVSDGNTIPPGARFIFFAPDENFSRQAGGAILTFRYMQAGQRKSSISYLAPAILRSATR